MNKHNPILDILDSKLYEYITKHLKVKFVRGTYFKCPMCKVLNVDYIPDEVDEETKHIKIWIKEYIT